MDNELKLILKNYSKVKDFIKEYQYEILLAIIVIGTLIYRTLNSVSNSNNNNNKIILVTQYYEPNNEERKKEIKECLINNSKNKLIDEIHLFVEKDYDLSFVNLNKIKLIYNDKQLSFKESFDYSNDNFDNKNIIVLANSDIYFNNTLRKIHDFDFDKTFYALTRHNLDKSGKPIFEKNLSGNGSEWTQDVWIWKTPINVIRNKINETDFFEENDGIILGIGACDNRIVKIMKETGYNVKNIGIKIQCIHNHKHDYRTWRTDSKKLKISEKYRKNGTSGLTVEK